MERKNLAILTVSKKGYKLAKSLNLEDSDIYVLAKYNDGTSFEIKGSLSITVKKIFFEYKTLLFIMASGIVVRTIAPIIKKKDIDPAVLVMDEQGLFISSLLSGHLGGANERANVIAKACDSIPVISTASDVSKKIAVDTIAMKLKGKIDSLEDAKNVTALIVNGENVTLNLPSNIVDEKSNSAGVVLVSNRKNIEVSQIVPQNIIVGIGCRKGKCGIDIIAAINKELEKLNIRKDSIKHFSTGWIKANEEGIVQAAKYFDVKLKIIEKTEIKKVHDQFIGSEFVEKTIGVKSISAPSAFVSSCGKGKFLLEKSKNSGITISVYEEEISYAR